MSHNNFNDECASHKSLREAAKTLLDVYGAMFADTLHAPLDKEVRALRIALAVPAQGDDALDARRYRRLRGIYMSLLCSHIGMKPTVRFMKNLEHPDFTPEMLDAVVDVEEDGR